MEEQDIKNAGLKVTVPRVKILQLLESAPNSHMSAEDVYKALMAGGEDVGLATVYRVLTQFEEKGLLVRHNFNDGRSVFEIAKDEHHDHMVCMDTGEIVEFYSDDIERLQAEIAEKHGYDLVDHKLVLYVKKRS
ncbi:ferric iron uptake transcriptional regulator [Aestuariirhabdus sp. Z084]|uniref:ferric iron uptake transcriptional regulator n=1 Tax=Aestuariirhabdus haliotis TaxID=2918751 RepID=UPI00201B41F8|nr:ferric iron uptake transcriptional regulator [Aestuariirhabdus haliotis]MCL6419203.1 ferric iron uptake transcriptional regulator [Aestuariirhabdus haliotis]